MGDFLRAEIDAGRGYLPAADRVLRAFTQPFDDVRILIVGQDPYPTPGHAVGLSFSVDPSVRPLPRSLTNIFSEYSADLGLQAPGHGDLGAWARNGVLLLNRVLTVTPGTPGSHRRQGWEEITRCAVEALVERDRPLVAILWGRDAQSLGPLLGQTPQIVSPHPSPLSASRGFFAATAAVLNSIAAGNDFVAAYPSNGINDEAQSVFYVRDDSPIKSVTDIVGKTIAVNTLGAHLDYVVREALHQKGLPEDSANLIVVPGPQLEQVLRSGQVDVSAFGYWQTTFTGAALRNGGLRAVFDDTDVLGDIAGGFVVLRRDWIAAHPEEARIFVEQSARALDYARDHIAETRQIFARVLAECGENADVAQYFAGYGVRKGGLAVDHDIQFWIDVLEREGAVKPGQLKAKDILYVTGDARPRTEAKS